MGQNTCQNKSTILLVAGNRLMMGSVLRIVKLLSFLILVFLIVEALDELLNPVFALALDLVRI